VLLIEDCKRPGVRSSVGYLEERLLERTVAGPQRPDNLRPLFSRLRIDEHHTEHWAHGGRTELNNLVSLCRPHHRRVHEQGWRIHIADGIAVVEPPP
jgi:HNH endonuclease